MDTEDREDIMLPGPSSSETPHTPARGMGEEYYEDSRRFSVPQPLVSQV